MTWIDEENKGTDPFERLRAAAQPIGNAHRSGMTSFDRRTIALLEAAEAVLATATPPAEEPRDDVEALREERQASCDLRMEMTSCQEERDEQRARADALEKERKYQCDRAETAEIDFRNACDVGRKESERANKAEAALAAFKLILVEATVQPFDVGPCYIANARECRMDSRGPFAVEERRMEGVFGQLLTRIEAKVPGMTESVNRTYTKLNELEAELAKARELLASCVGNACIREAMGGTLTVAIVDCLGLGPSAPQQAGGGE